MMKLRLHLAKQILQNIHRRSPSLKYCTAASATPSDGSTREKLWRQAQRKYEDHPTILYSSYMETQLEEYMPHWTLQAKDRKERRQHRKESPQASAGNESHNVTQFPEHWMDDYEFYDGGTDENVNSKYGTADPMEPASKVPCNGCGANLHCQSISQPGYIPKEIFKGRTDNELKTITCQRCHFLKNYNIALDVDVTPEFYVETISNIKDDYALAILIVDLLDFPCSIWPGIQKVLGPKRPIFIVGNKVDLLPRDSTAYLERVTKTLKDQVVKSGLDALNVKYVSLISAKTGYGIEELITQLHKIWKYKGNVYLLGCTNVGKSSLFNILLNSDYCRPEASDLVRKATVCPWPGTTLQMLKFPILRPSDIRVYKRFCRLFNERAQKAAEEKLQRDQMRRGLYRPKTATLIGNVGQTFIDREDVNDMFSISSGTQPITSLNERSEQFKEARWCFDTPGVIHPDQMTSLLNPDELVAINPKEMIRPRAFRLKVGMSIFLAGLARLDFHSIEGAKNDWLKIFLFCSLQLPVVISPTVEADEMYQQYLGSEVLGLPRGSEERLQRWPGLQEGPNKITVRGEDAEQAELNDPFGSMAAHSKSLTCDIVLSSAGWASLRAPTGSECVFKAWTPHGRGIHVRDPPLIPYAGRLVGKHIRNSLAYNLAKPFVFRK